MFRINLLSNQQIIQLFISKLSVLIIRLVISLNVQDRFIGVVEVPSSD